MEEHAETDQQTLFLSLYASLCCGGTQSEKQIHREMIGGEGGRREKRDKGREKDTRDY